MLSSKRRIPKKDFAYILSNGKRYNSPSFLLYVANNQDKESQFSFSVSKKVFPNAVDRNRCRRWGYSILSQNIKRIKPGFFCFFSFKKGFKIKNFEYLEKEVLELLSSSLVLK